MGTQGNIKNSYVLKGKIRDVPGVDKTLTLEGYCADAKATGEALTAAGRSLESQGNDIDILKSGLEFERKRIEMMIASGNTNGLTTYNFTFLDGYNKTVNATAISNGSVVVVRTETFGVKGVGAANQNPLPYTLIEFPSMPDEFRCAFENGYIDVKHAGSEQSDVYYIEDGTDIKIKNTTAEGFGVEYLELCYPLETVRIPEVMDARIGADGTEYRNLGTAIRAQLNLKTDKCFTDEKRVYMAEPARMHVGEEFEAGDTIRYYWEASELEIGVDYNDGTASEVIKTPETPGSSELVIGENYASVRFDEGFTVCLPNKKALPDNAELTDGSYFIVGENGSSTKIAYPLLKESIVGELPGTVKELTQHVTEGFETVNEEVSNVKGEVERIRKDLITPVVKVTKTEEGCVVSATDKSGTTEVTIRNGQDGKDGENGLDGQDGKDGENGTDGKDGVGIASVTQTKVSSEDGGTNELTFELTNGEKKVFVVNNGKRGPDGQDGEDGKDAYEYAKEGGYTGTEAEFAELMARGRDVPTKVSELENDAGFLTQHQDLSGYAKSSEIPTKTSQLTNDSGFLTQHQDLSGYAKSSEIPTKTSQLTNDSGYLDGEHNTSETAHSDIRLSIQGLMNQLYAIADSDDATLDQLSEIVGYIKSNKSLIESITTNKVEVSHIVDNLYSNVANRPLSAAQGVVLKGLIDNLSTEVTNHISTAGDKVDAHNTNENAHEDIRYMIDQHTNQFGNYVQKQHIVDNLEQAASGNMVLSAHQGYVLKQLIDKITVPTKLSELENDKVFVTKEEVESIVSESGGSSTEAGIEAIKLYVNPTDGATTGSNTVTSDKDNFGSIFDITEPELHSYVLVYKNESDDIGYTPDTVRTYIASGTLLGMYDGRTVVIRAEKYELTIVEKVADDGVISYVSLWNIRKDITTDVISTYKKTDAMTLPVGLNKETGVLWAEPNVVPVAKTDAMTQEVGVDSEGKLFTAPGGSVSDEQIESAVNSYLEENPVSGGASKWSELSGVPTTEMETYNTKVIYPETTVEFESGSNQTESFVNTDDFRAGNVIIITIDGVSYTDTVVSKNVDGTVAIAIGNFDAAMGTGDDGRPYALAVVETPLETLQMMAIIADATIQTSTHNIKIELQTVDASTEPLPSGYNLSELPVKWDAIKGKPFGVDSSNYDENHIYFEETVDGFTVGGTNNNIQTNNYAVEMEMIPYSELKEGRIFTVLLDGEEYQVTARYFNGAIFYLGNLSLISNLDDAVDTGETFLYAASEILQNNTFITTHDGASHDLKIIGEKGTKKIIKLPEEYLPDGIGATTWNTLSERPFGIEVTPTSAIFENETPAQVLVSYLPADTETGDGFIYTLEGVEYHCVAERITHVDGGYYLYLGNKSLKDNTLENTGEPFLFWDYIASWGCSSDGGVIYYANTVTDTTSTLKRGNAKVNKLPTYFNKPKWDNIEDKPFYIEVVIGETIYENESIGNFTSSDGLDGVEIDCSGFPTSYNTGDAFRISFDNAEYISYARVYDTGVYIGNIYIAGGGYDTGETFVIKLELSDTGVASAHILTTNTGYSSHSLKIEKCTENIKRLQEKLLPLPPCTLTITDAATVTAEILNTTIPTESVGLCLYQMDNEDLLKAKIIIKSSTQNIINYATPSYAGYLGDADNSKLIAFVAGIGMAYITIASDGTMTYNANLG